MKASINIITTALLTLLSAIGATAAEPNPSAGTRVDYINSQGQRFWSSDIDAYQNGQLLFQVNHGENGWYVVNSQYFGDEETRVNSVRFVPWGTESYSIDLDTDIPTEYYVKPSDNSNNRKPGRIKANEGANFNVQCGDTVVLVMELPDKAYPSLDFLYCYTEVLPNGEENWQETTATPFLYYSGGLWILNPRLLTQADQLDKYLSEYIKGSPSYTRLPETDKCKNRWGYEFVMPNEPFKIKIGFDYADGRVLRNSVLTTLYKSLYTQFHDLDFNGNTGENWIMRYFGDGMSQEQINNLTISDTGFTGMSHLNKANLLPSAIPWADYYCGIILSNMILDHLDVFDRAAEREKDNAKAQLLALRAHCYTRILQIYGKRWQDSENGAALCAPLILGSKDIQKPLSSMKDIKDRIYEDLDKALQIFQGGSFNRIDILQPDLNVARGLKMRAALLTEDWITARDMAQLILADVPLSTNADMLSGFYKRRDSWIWGASSNAVFDKLSTQIYYWSPQNYNSCNGAYPPFWGVGASAIDRDLWLQIQGKDIRRSLFAMPEMLDNARMKEPGNWYNPDNVTFDQLFFLINNSQDKAAMAVARQYKASRPETKAFIYGVDDYSYVPIPFGAQLKFWSTGDSYGYDYSDYNGDAATLFMRSDEALLTQAEACFMLGDEATARDLVNKLNTMRQCDASASSGQSLLDEIRFTRRIELWGEGFGFFDRKRWNLPITRNIWVANDPDSGNWPAPQTPAAEVSTSAANGWRAPIPAYYVKQNPNIDSSKMDYSDVTGYTADESAPAAAGSERNLRAVSEEMQSGIDTSVTF